jgi:hypothetical protein
MDTAQLVGALITVACAGGLVTYRIIARRLPPEPPAHDRAWPSWTVDTQEWKLVERDEP